MTGLKLRTAPVDAARAHRGGAFYVRIGRRDAVGPMERAGERNSGRGREGKRAAAQTEAAFLATAQSLHLPG
jgi:hypothetical protein